MTWPTDGSLLRARNAEEGLVAAVAPPRASYAALHVNGAWLMANSVATGLLGVGFWAVAARLFPSSTIGREGALVNAMVGLSAIGQLGLNAVVARFLPLAGSGARRLIARSYALAAVATAVLTGVLVISADVSGTDPLGVTGSAGTQLLFVLSAVAWCIFVLQDAVLAAVRAARWVAVENIVFGVAKISLLPLAVTLHLAHGVFVAWVVPMLVLLVPVNACVLLRTRDPEARGADSPVMRALGRRGVRRFVGMEFASATVVQLSGTLLPVLVAGVLGAADSAVFYLPFLVVLTADLLVLGWTTSLTVEAAHQESAGLDMGRSVASRCVVLVLAIVVGGLVLAPLMTVVFGHRSTVGAVEILRLLVLASPARAVLTLYAAVCRVRGRGLAILISQGAVVPLLFTGVIVLGRSNGPTGVAVAWVLANTLVAAFVLPALLRDLRRGSSAAAPPLEAHAVTAAGVAS